MTWITVSGTLATSFQVINAERHKAGISRGAHGIMNTVTVPGPVSLRALAPPAVRPGARDRDHA